MRSCSDMSMASVLSRRSGARARSSSRQLLSTEELECQRAQEGQQQVRTLMRLNAENLQRILAPPEPLRVSQDPLTLPTARQLHTERRARSRTESIPRSAASVQEASSLLGKLPHREALAVERHLEQQRGALTRRLTPPRQRSAAGLLRDMPRSDREQWTRQACTAEERAQRARIVAQERRAEVERNQQNKLFVFRRSGEVEASATKFAPTTPDEELECRAER